MKDPNWQFWTDVATIVLPALFVVYFLLSANEELGKDVYRDRAIAGVFVFGACQSAWRIWRRRRP
jgi:hypothetical protein